MKTLTCVHQRAPRALAPKFWIFLDFPHSTLLSMQNKNTNKNKLKLRSDPSLQYYEVCPPQARFKKLYSCYCPFEPINWKSFSFDFTISMYGILLNSLFYHFYLWNFIKFPFYHFYVWHFHLILFFTISMYGISLNSLFYHVYVWHFIKFSLFCHFYVWHFH